MRFSEAMKALEEGKKIKCPSFKGNVAFLSEDFGILMSLDWELYEEPSVVLHLTCPECKQVDVALKKRVMEWRCPFCPPKSKTLSFAEVVKGLREGKRFSRQQWAKGMYLDKDKSAGYTAIGVLLTYAIQTSLAIDESKESMKGCIDELWPIIEAKYKALHPEGKT